MIVCIPSQGPTLDSRMDDRFGRASYLIFFDSNFDSSRILENPHAGGSGGVGPMVVQFLVQNGTEVLIAPKLGGNADTGLRAAHIRVIMQNPDISVEEAYLAWKKNEEISG